MPNLVDLLLIGTGGLARETAEAVRAINAVAPTWRLRGFLDDNAALHGTQVAGLDVIGPTEAVHDHPEAQVVLCTGRPTHYLSRPWIAERLALPDERYATVIHPTASLGSTCAIGAGTILLAHVALTADVVVGRHVAVMPQVVLTHDVRVDDFVTIGSGVRLGGTCHLAEGAYVGSGVCVREGLRIGARAMLGMSAVVTRDVPDERMWFGAPARDEGPAPLPERAPR